MRFHERIRDPNRLRLRVLAVYLWAGLAAVAMGQEVSVEQSTGGIRITVGRIEEQDYVLSAGNPVAFSVTGPTYVRVYTRLRWPKATGVTARYVVALAGPRGMRHETLVAARSGSALGPAGESFAKWRSFYVRVPAGRTAYRLDLLSAASDTVAVRFAFEAPPPWQELTTTGAGPTCRIQDDSGATDWRRVDPNSGLDVTVTGPARFRIDARLLFLASVYGKKDFELEVYDGDVEVQALKLEVLRKKKARCLSDQARAPSVVRRALIDLPVGPHDLKIRAKAGTDVSVVVRLFTKRR